MRARLICLLIGLTIAGCQAAPSTALSPAATPVLPRGAYLRVDGSTSTLPLQQLIACRLLEVECVWQEGDLFTTTWHVVPALDQEASEQVLVSLYQIWHSGTHTAYENLIHKETDFILVARKPSQDELDEARRSGVELQVVPVAHDAFVFITHTDNPVSGLTLEQLRAIYTGDLRSWAQVGGLDRLIHPYQRNRNSGSQELMQELVMHGEAMIDAPDMILEGMMGPIHAILDDREGIGYSVYYYATRIFPRPELRLLAVDGIQPALETLANGAYPLTTEVYAVLRGNLRASHPARQLLAWLLSAEGQAIIAESGYVPLDPNGD
jgi:phosphate transport system substrate-binding protein